MKSKYIERVMVASLIPCKNFAVSIIDNSDADRQEYIVRGVGGECGELKVEVVCDKYPTASDIHNRFWQYAVNYDTVQLAFLEEIARNVFDYKCVQEGNKIYSPGAWDRKQAEDATA